MVFNSTTSVCDDCPIGCDICDRATLCTTCGSPFIPDNTTCQCNTTNEEYYDPANLTCSSCGSIFTNCSQCSGTGYFSECVACLNGTYLVNSTCLPCPANSTHCDSETNSTACLPTFSLTVTAGLCLCDTAAQLFFDPASHSCFDCAFFVNNCTTCG